MRKRLLIGLDIGTSGAKCLAADEDGTVLASSVQEYPLYTPKPGWAEQHPEDWWQAVRKGLAEILPRIPKEDIAGIAFSGQMHGLVALDKDGQVIRPAYLWCDQRSEPQCLSLTEKAGGQEGLLRYTNNRMLSGYTGGKLLWLKENDIKTGSLELLSARAYNHLLLNGYTGMHQIVFMTGISRNMCVRLCGAQAFGDRTTDQAKTEK